MSEWMSGELFRGKKYDTFGPRYTRKNTTTIEQHYEKCSFKIVVYLAFKPLAVN